MSFTLVVVAVGTTSPMQHNNMVVVVASMEVELAVGTINMEVGLAVVMTILDIQHTVAVVVNMVAELTTVAMEQHKEEIMDHKVATLVVLHLGDTTVNLAVLMIEMLVTRRRVVMVSTIKNTSPPFPKMTHHSSRKGFTTFLEKDYCFKFRINISFSNVSNPLNSGIAFYITKFAFVHAKRVK